jgi:argininosuccinate synthase
MLKELADRGCRVTALAVDVGEGAAVKELQEITRRFGVTLRVVDARDEFALDAVLPAIRAQARYLGMYPISSSLSRPILARTAVRLAHELGCDAIIHTANQSQNSLRRLNGAIEQLGFSGLYGTPYEFSAMTRAEKIDALQAVGMSKFQARGISGDANLWCREFESGALDNPEAFWVPESLFDWTAPSNAIAVAADFSVTFECGVPVALDGQCLPLLSLISRLNLQAGAFGVRRFSGLEHLEQGGKVLEVREAIEGRWFGAVREAADSFIASTARHVTGTVGYRLRPGAADVCSIKADKPLYLTDRDSWEQKVARERAQMQLTLPATRREAVYA